MAGEDGEMRTTAQGVVERFTRSTDAQRKLANWRRRSPGVADHVLQHVTRVPYTLTSQQVREAASHDHALHEIDSKEVSVVTSIADWRPDFAMTHVFHYALETIGEPFSFEQFRDFCQRDPKASTMLWKPAQRACSAATKDHDHRLVFQAMQWRIGNFYYSFMRELDVVAAMRERSIPLEVHPLADALFRADAWIDDTVFILYIKNHIYRDGLEGRKEKTQEILGDSYRYVTCAIEARHEYGKPWMATPDDLERVATQIHQELGR